MIRFNLAFILISSQGKAAFGAEEPYYAGMKGEVCNHVNDVIRSEAQCSDALQNLGYENLPSFWTGEFSQIPSGCSISSQPHFETSTTGLGTGREDLTPICVNSKIFNELNVECERYRNENQSPFCENQGLCVVDSGSLTCKCTASYYGDRCEKRVLELDDCYANFKKDYDEYGNLNLKYKLVMPTLDCFQKHIETILNIFKMNNLKINDLD